MYFRQKSAGALLIEFVQRLVAEDDTGIARSEFRDCRKAKGCKMRSKANIRAGEAPVIVMDQGKIRGVFATRELAAQFSQKHGCPHASLFRDDGSWDLNRFRGQSPWTVQT